MHFSHAVNVRMLAEFSLESGDLAMSSRAVDRMREGMLGHLAVQQALDDSWRREESIAREEQVGGISLTIQGRADAVRRIPGLVAVEEIKTTRRPVDEIGADDYPAHWAQAQIYAYMLCMNEGIELAEVALIYYNMSGTRTRFMRSYNVQKLAELFLRYAEPYAAWICAMDQWAQTSRPSIKGMKFPYETYRDGQRELAKHTFIALRDSQKLLAEAPTGIGKTAATLFGAVKALGQGHISGIFYLTARTTGRVAAEMALERMRAAGLHIRSVTLTAKEKCCAREGGVYCDDCLYAVEYFDRRRDALYEAFDIEKLGAAEIYEFAIDRQLCPFELSLDLSEQADVIICDYNYAFDPSVRLKRYFDSKSSAALLVDEAHNLPDRARDMLSAELSAGEVARLRREVGKIDGRKCAMYRALSKLLLAMEIKLEEIESRAEPPQGVAEAADKLADAIGGDLSIGHPLHDELTNLMLECVWFSRVGRMFDEKTHRALLTPEGKRARVKLWCYDPSVHLKDTFKRVGGAVLFSATLTPMDFYAREMSVSDREGDALLKLESPFPRENLLVLTMPILTRYRERERTLDEVVRALYVMCAARPGNYLACFPSHAYLGAVHDRFAWMHPDVRRIRQMGRMDDAARAAFLDQLQPGARESTLAFIAMGGVFAEGVDLPGDRVIGAAVVGVGIPQLGFERDILRELCDDGMGGGYDFAYVYPGMRRVLQAAGRVIRTETDRGAVLLIDSRFLDDKYQELMPAHWDARCARSAPEAGRMLAKFWGGLRNG